MSSLISEPSRHSPFHAASWLHHRLSAVVEGLRSHRPLYLVAGATFTAGLLIQLVLHRDPDFALTSLISTNMLVPLPAIILMWLLTDLVRLWRCGYAGSPTAALLRRLSNDVLSPERVANSLHAYLPMAVFILGFTAIKPSIPHLNPFAWDRSLMELDRLLHFGTAPHEVLAPILQFPLATLILNIFYNLWFFVAMGFFIWQGYQGRDTFLRQRFLLAYLLCWGLGSGVLGVLLSSAGPSFYGRLNPGADPYAGLMNYLAEANMVYPIWALKAQDMLWHSYTTGNGMVSGISAMPSMHVATSVMFFICARAAGLRWLTWCTGVFAMVILLGSILLGWHYAADGYVGALVAAGCWWLAGVITRLNGLSSRPS